MGDIDLGSPSGRAKEVTLSQYLLQVVSIMMAGHLVELALSGAAIATSFYNVTGFSLLVKFPYLRLLHNMKY
ncbi:hypothetical protein PTKIN_Ptkin12aG0046300 [Pterospermum kingtungense]